VQIPLPSATKSTCWEATIAATMAAAMRPARITEVAFRVLRTGTCQIVRNSTRVSGMSAETGETKPCQLGRSEIREINSFLGSLRCFFNISID